MPPLLRDLQRFIGALWKEWRVILTGSGLAAFFVLWKLSGGADLSGVLAWWVIALTFAFACFLVWRREYRAAQGPTGALPESTPAEERIFVSESIYSLVEPYQKYTSVQAGKLAEVYLGKWLKVNGEVSEVSRRLGRKGYEILFYIDRKIFIQAEFERQWDEHLRLLRRDQSISAIGKIRGLNSSQIWLEDCEIVHPPTA